MQNKRGTRALTLNMNENFLPKSKRSQLTIFIIIAILIIAVVVLFFTFRGSLQIPGKPANLETAEIQNFVQECLDDSLEKVVFRIGENGGYYFPPKISTPFLDVPYYIKNNKNLMPQKEKIQEEISKYVSRDLVFCLGDFALFPEYEITKGKMVAETKIEQDRVLIDMNYPLTIIKGESKSKIENFNSEVPVRLGIVYNAVAEFVEQQIESKAEKICVDCILISFAPQGLKSNIFWEDNETSIFIVRDFNSIVKDREFVFNFAGEF